MVEADHDITLVKIQAELERRFDFVAGLSTICGFRRSRTVFPIVKPDTVPIRSRTRFRFDAGQSELCFLGSC